MNIMITGCAGFIGSHAVEEFLRHGYTVTGVDVMTYAASVSNMSTFLTDITFFKDDICDTSRMIEIIDTQKISWIINFAAESHVDNSIRGCDDFIYSNIFGVKSLLEACRKTGCKILHVSTDEVYGSINEGSFVEGDVLNPKNPYSATKAAAEHLICAYANTYGVEYKIVRMSNNFGPRQHAEKLVPTIIRCARANEKIPVYGNGENIRDWFYVKDCVSMLRDIHELGMVNEVYNLTLCNEKKNIEVVKLILDIMGKEHSLIEFVEDRAGHDFRYSINNEKILSLCDASPTDMYNALYEMIHG